MERKAPDLTLFFGSVRDMGKEKGSCGKQQSGFRSKFLSRRNSCKNGYIVRSRPGRKFQREGTAWLWKKEKLQSPITSASTTLPVLRRRQGAVREVGKVRREILSQERCDRGEGDEQAGSLTLPTAWRTLFREGEKKSSEKKVEKGIHGVTFAGILRCSIN